MSILDRLQNILNSLIDGLGNVIFAVLLLIVALVVAAIVKSLVVKGLSILKLDEKLAKFGIANGSALVELIGKIAWFVVFLLFMPSVFSKLGMESVTTPINNLVYSIIGFIPNLLAAAILIVCGIILSDIIKQILQPLFKMTKMDLLQAKVGIKATEKTALSAILAEVCKVLIMVFFVVQAIQALNLSVLSAVGGSIIAYIPKVIASLLIVLAAVIASSALEKFIVKTNPKMKGFALIAKVIVYVFAVFMVLSQLNIAAEIVNMAFKYTLLAVCVAFAVAFGVGGRDFAKNMLAKLEKKIDDNN